MMTDEHMAAEVMRRTCRARATHRRALAAVVAALSLLCIALVALALPSMPQELEDGLLGRGGSLLGADTTGRYVLVGALAFVLGTLTARIGICKGARNGRNDH